MFFSPSFDLSRRSTFYKVYESETDQNGHINTDKFKRQLISIEKELSNRLNSRSDDFLSAFEDFRNLQVSIQDAFTTSRQIKENLSYVHQNLVQDSLTIVKLKSRKQNYENLLHILRLIAHVKQSMKTIEDLIQYDDVILAKKLLSEVKSSIEIHLIGLKCIKGLRKQFKEIEVSINDKLLKKFIDLTTSSSLKSSDESDIAFLYTQELIDSGMMSKALETYSITQDANIRSFMRNKFGNGTNDPNVLYNDEEMARMDINIFIDKAQLLFEYVIFLIKQAVFVKETIEKVNSLNYEMDGDTKKKFVSEARDMINFLSESSFIRVGKIYKLRIDQHKRLFPSKFVQLYNITQDFIKGCELLSNKEGGSSLRSTLISQKRAFVDFIHEHNLSKLNSILENETWSRAEIAGDFALILMCLMDPLEPLNCKSNTPTENKRDVTIRNRKYLLVNSSLLFSTIIHDYLSVIEEMPSLYSDIVTRLAEILRVYNKRVYHLVLGRGSVKLNVVKSISAVHLALVFQQLSLIIDLVPMIKERIEKFFKHPKEKALFHDLDEVLKDLNRHRQEIIDKFVFMMTDRMMQIFKDYQVSDSDKPCRQFVELYEKTKVLHKILNTVLNRDDFKNIIGLIINAYSENLSKILYGTNPSDKKKIKDNAQYFSDRLQELEGVDDSMELVIRL